MCLSLKRTAILELIAFRQHVRDWSPICFGYFWHLERFLLVSLIKLIIVRWQRYYNWCLAISYFQKGWKASYFFIENESLGQLSSITFINPIYRHTKGIFKDKWSYHICDREPLSEQLTEVLIFFCRVELDVVEYLVELWLHDGKIIVCFKGRKVNFW